MSIPKNMSAFMSQNQLDSPEYYGMGDLEKHLKSSSYQTIGTPLYNKATAEQTRNPIDTYQEKMDTLKHIMARPHDNIMANIGYPPSTHNTAFHHITDKSKIFYPQNFNVGVLNNFQHLSLEEMTKLNEVLDRRINQAHKGLIGKIHGYNAMDMPHNLSTANGFSINKQANPYVEKMDMMIKNLQ